MRTETIDALTNYARNNSDVVLLTADLGYSVLERFSDELPNQYANVGVCEQAMVGIAAGMALSGKRVVLYSIANFPTLRCLEQIRNDVCYHNLPVVIISVGGGFSYGAQGYTHHGIEDLGIMSMLPNIAVSCPSDPIEAQALIVQLLERRRPAYLRLGRSGEPLIHSDDTTISYTQAIRMTSGSDVALLAMGPILGRAIKASENLKIKGVSSSVYSFPSLVPLDLDGLSRIAKKHKAILTIEEHSVNGGFGMRVADYLLSSGLFVRFGKYGVLDTLYGKIGKQEWLLDQMEPIEKIVMDLL